MIGVRFVWLKRLRLRAHNLLKEYRFGGEDQYQYIEQVYRTEREVQEEQQISLLTSPLLRKRVLNKTVKQKRPS